VLREANLIAAEDTRRTAKLLSHYGIHTPTLSFHAHNSRTRIPKLIARLRDGGSVALVTDAGTPAISDPGAEFVTACRLEGIAVDPVPGASAALVAAVGSGFPLNSVTFLGFPPLKAKARASWMNRLVEMPGTVVFFEAPHRIEALLVDMRDKLGKRQICVARELTKAHQEFLTGPADADSFRSITRKGEFTLVIAPSESPADEASTPSDAAIVGEFRSLDISVIGQGRRGAAAEVARRLGLTANEVYRALERSKL
jgi:16S rRNA (cytidine1402-2'-O)-methyltransferase